MAALVGSRTRPRTGETVCGDVGAVIPFSRGLRLVLADGLGHGQVAQESAELACQYVRAHAEDPIETLLCGIDRELGGMRGAAISVLALHFAERRVLFTGVGNVELRAVASASISPPTMPGIVGRRIRPAKVWEYPLVPGDLLVLMSDGISSCFDLADLAHLAVQAIADALIERHHKDHDDASCMVVRVVA